MPNQVVNGRFEVLELIGRGSFGSVYRVKRLHDVKEYALKTVDLNSMSQKERQDAVNEIRCMASVRHPNVLCYYEAFLKDSGTLCIVTEYADNGDLESKIRYQKQQRTYFDEDLVWCLFIQLCFGLKSLHENAIIHRDLKAANCLLTMEGECKIGDFGCSKFLHNGALANTQIGTPYYISPEIWKNKPYSMSSDIWSLGCMLYELAALRPPFRAPDMKALAHKVSAGNYPRIPSHFSRDLAHLIKVIIVCDPNERPTINQILAMPSVLKRGVLLQRRFGLMSNLNLTADVEASSASSVVDRSLHVSTIRVPKDLTQLSAVLPAPRYPVDQQQPERGNAAGSRSRVPPASKLNARESHAGAATDRSTWSSAAPDTRRQGHTQAQHPPTAATSSPPSSQTAVRATKPSPTAAPQPAAAAVPSAPLPSGPPPSHSQSGDLETTAITSETTERSPPPPPPSDGRAASPSPAAAVPAPATAAPAHSKGVDSTRGGGSESGGREERQNGKAVPPPTTTTATTTTTTTAPTTTTSTSATTSAGKATKDGSAKAVDDGPSRGPKTPLGDITNEAETPVSADGTHTDSKSGGGDGGGGGGGGGRRRNSKKGGDTAGKSSTNERTRERERERERERRDTHRQREAPSTHSTARDRRVLGPQAGPPLLGPVASDSPQKQASAAYHRGEGERYQVYTNRRGRTSRTDESPRGGTERPGHGAARGGPASNNNRLPATEEGRDGEFLPAIRVSVPVSRQPQGMRSHAIEPTSVSHADGRHMHERPHARAPASQNYHGGPSSNLPRIPNVYSYNTPSANRGGLPAHHHIAGNNPYANNRNFDVRGYHHYPQQQQNRHHPATNQYGLPRMNNHYGSGYGAGGGAYRPNYNSQWGQYARG